MQLRTALCVLTLSLLGLAVGQAQSTRPSPPTIASNPKQDQSNQSASSHKKKPHSVELKWKASATKGIEGYYVYRAVGGAAAKYERITPKAVKETTYKDSKVEPGKSYSYAVSTVQKRGAQVVESDRTPPVVVQIPNP